ncbi:MAG: helix-turn-helix domain-containing protein, partial [Proteobacteria bacterium]|nr:helix-turn-helix domain-containing protein [Pseudomonadota bacterium]
MGTNYKHLSCKERTMIQLSLEQGCPLRVIARSLQRAPRSIRRELKRNGWTNPTTGARKCGRPLLGWRERHAAHRVWPKLARCGATAHDCCAIGIRRNRSRACCAECSRTTRRSRSATRPATPRFTPCRAVSCV